MSVITEVCITATGMLKDGYLRLSGDQYKAGLSGRWYLLVWDRCEDRIMVPSTTLLIEGYRGDS